MGEKIKDLSNFCIGKSKIKIELNNGYSKSYSKYDIHIQSDNIQYCLSEAEFMKFASTIINAKRKLDSIKNPKTEVLPNVSEGD